MALVFRDYYADHYNLGLQLAPDAQAAKFSNIHTYLTSAGLVLVMTSERWAEGFSNSESFCIEHHKTGLRPRVLRLPHSFYITSLQRDQEKALATMFLLRELMQQGDIIQVPKEKEGEGFYSHIFLIKKPSGKFPLIINLKILNKSIRYQRFRMDTIFL